MLALARKIVNGDADDAESVEAVFAQARDAEATAEELLVDDGWKDVESLPRTGYGAELEVFGANGNGHQNPDGIGPTVELPLGNGHRDGTPEPQQSLFSWAEFIADEPVKPKGRQPATLSMFEWAMSMEQSRRGRAGRRRTLDRTDTGRPPHMGRRPSRRWQCN